MKPILSFKELERISDSIKKGLKEIEVSLDLGLSKTKIKLDKKGFYIKNKLIELTKIKDDNCYIISNDKLEQVQYFSEETNNLYKLVPTSEKPILKISGTPMHKKSFIERIEKDKLKGNILDSGTGLGYTAIVSSKTADKVTTIEFDKAVIEIAKLNPYSQNLFNNKNIKIIIGDLTKKIKEFKDEEFDNIILDAGTPRSSGDFFSLKNYQEAFRVLKNGGKLYHYLPRVHVQRGRDFGAEVIERLKNSNFQILERNLEGSYVVCKK